MPVPKTHNVAVAKVRRAKTWWRFLRDVLTNAENTKWKTLGKQLTGTCCKLCSSQRPNMRMHARHGPAELAKRKRGHLSSQLSLNNTRAHSQWVRSSFRNNRMNHWSVFCCVLCTRIVSTRVTSGTSTSPEFHQGSGAPDMRAVDTTKILLNWLQRSWEESLEWYEQQYFGSTNVTQEPWQIPQFI